MERKELEKLIDTAMGRSQADLVIKNANIVDVYTGEIFKGEIAVSCGLIAGVLKYDGNASPGYDGKKIIEAGGKYAVPGLIDSHIHIESSYTSPEEFGRMVVPCGTTTVIADPHEIVNVYGIDGLKYMKKAASHTALDVRYMIPSCVPATPFENAGAAVDAFDMAEPLSADNVPGMAEFMNVPGILNKGRDELNKIIAARNLNKVIDGHSPDLKGPGLNAYIASGVSTDHECVSLDEMQERLERGMYVLLRDGSACHDLENLVKGVTPYNYRRCLVCSDDRQPATILSEGHVNSHLKKLVKNGIDPVMAVAMATLNAAECYRLFDRGGIAPGKRADIVLFDDLKDFRPEEVFIAGRQVAENGKYLLSFEKEPIDTVRGSMHVKEFTADDLRMHLKSDLVKTIEVCPGGVRTKRTDVKVKLDKDGDLVFDPSADVAKVAVLERHHATGNIGLGLLKGYGIKEGAIALSVAHDSHNIICVGVSNEEMKAAIDALIEQEGGFVLVKDGHVLASLPLPIAGLMSELSGERVKEELKVLHDKAFEELKVSRTVEPVMTLCFMSLIVIPELKITDTGLFDVGKFEFTSVEV
ncbi:MAG: adenine deaminase [Lachnospiraceae bacterium]|jgi:adenine deaminase|nr:adenine deaminase [Lachnospiraceae bacterium]MEE3461615.1 adenine deaminase [Lachnospiraceae bacterium]